VNSKHLERAGIHVNGRIDFASESCDIWGIVPSGDGIGVEVLLSTPDGKQARHKASSLIAEGLICKWCKERHPDHHYPGKLPPWEQPE
jgi:hypothetical protein